jgi:hypothetical protein
MVLGMLELHTAESSILNTLTTTAQFRLPNGFTHQSRLFGLAVSHKVTGGELPAQRSRQAGMPGNTRTTVVELNGIAPLRADRKLKAETQLHKAVSTVSQVNLPLCAML